MLIPSYRRQAIVLRLAHLHAILHANRLFLLGSSFNTHENQVTECIKAAKALLETVDEIAQEGPIFHAFWWTHYVTFCALVVTYVWEIRQRRIKHSNSKHDRSMLLELAERCHTHLAKATASNSPSRRYAVILEEFRTMIADSSAQPTIYPSEKITEFSDMGDCGLPEHPIAMSTGQEADIRSTSILSDAQLFSQWNTTDWLDIDSSVRIHAYVYIVSALLNSFSRHFGCKWIWMRVYYGQIWAKWFHSTMRDILCTSSNPNVWAKRILEDV